MFDPKNLDRLAYWINEREKMRLKKEAGRPRPWTDNHVMRTTYFCNVHREHDNVTRWIREHFPRGHTMPEFNMMVARMVNKPSSLIKMGWPFTQWDETNRVLFEDTMRHSGSWGSAYIVSTNGRAMPKHGYVSGLLTMAVAPLEQVVSCASLAAAHVLIQRVQGLGSFMSAQIIADLKNTPGYPLAKAEDWWTWCAHGPGSLRGMGWLLYPNHEKKCTPLDFQNFIPALEIQLKPSIQLIEKICRQDLQNCLCEFDKFMRVTSGTGRSKRNYTRGG